MEAACTSVSTLMLKGVQIGCAELLDVESMRVMNYALDQRFEEAPTILFKFSGTAGQVREAIHEAGEVCTNLGGHKFSFAGDKNASFLFSEDNKSTASFHSLSCGHHQMPPTPTTPTTSKQTIPKPTPATSPTPATPTSPTPTSPTATAIACSASELWSARKGLLWSIQAYRENADNSKQQYTTDETDSKWVPCVTDVCVPISKLAEAVVATKEDLQSQGMFFAPVFGHVGDGNYHVVIMFDANNPEHLQASTQQTTHETYHTTHAQPHSNHTHSRHTQRTCHTTHTAHTYHTHRTHTHSCVGLQRCITSYGFSRNRYGRNLHR
eukprot:GHVS01087872.1.p1 GENE.GHVS01087872.1~~GHVS01087872.1.p1  ORF type:complete len:324 (-),score=36.10 GHVS01087872.1:437-1408(-)